MGLGSGLGLDFLTLPTAGGRIDLFFLYHTAVAWKFSPVPVDTGCSDIITNFFVSYAHFPFLYWKFSISSMKGAQERPTAVTGILEEKTNSPDDDEVTRLAEETMRSPLHEGETSTGRGVLPARDRGESNEDSDSSAVDSDEDEVRACLCLRGGGRE